MPLLWVLRDELGITSIQVRLRSRAVWRLHRPDRRRRRAILPVAYRRCRRQVGRHDRRVGQQGAASGSAGLDRTSGSAMRLLPDRPDHAGHFAAWIDPQADGRGHQRGDVRQPLPLRHLSAHSRRDPRGCRKDGGNEMGHADVPAALSFSALPPSPAASLSAPTATCRAGSRLQRQSTGRRPCAEFRDLQPVGRDQPRENHADRAARRHRPGRRFRAADHDRRRDGPRSRPVQNPIRRAEPGVFQHRLRRRVRAVRGGGPKSAAEEAAPHARISQRNRPADDRRVKYAPGHLSKSCALPARSRARR